MCDTQKQINKKKLKKMKLIPIFLRVITLDNPAKTINAKPHIFFLQGMVKVLD